MRAILAPALAGLLAALLAASTLPAQQPGPAQPLAAQLRALYFQQDFEAVHRLGARDGAPNSDDPQTRAWYVIGLARSALEKAAVAAADEMVARWPEDTWSHVARSVAVGYDGRMKEGIEIAARATELAPDSPYAWWALGLARHRASEYAAVVAMVDSVFPDRFAWAELQVLKANALVAQGGRADSVKLEQAHALFAQARERDPSNVNAHFFPASNLVYGGDLERGMPLLERAREMAPYSSSILAVYWTGANTRRDVPAEERRAAIRAVAEQVLQARPDYAGALTTVVDAYQILGDNAAVAGLEARILRDIPDSGQAEGVLAARQRALADSLYKGTAADSGAARQRLRQMLWAFVDRPVHRRPTLLGDAYLSLFHELRDDSTVSDEVMLRVAQGVARHNRFNPHITHSAPPAMLAERGVYFREAEAIVREGLELIGPYMEEREQAFPTAGDYALAEDRLKGIHRGALGWIYFQEGRLNDAERELNQAYELNRESGAISYYLGRLAQARGRLQDAEMHYSRGYATEVLGGSKPSTAALEALYREMHGSIEGWDTYLGNLAERERQARRDKLAASRIAQPRPLPAFELAMLHGGTFADTQLAGKIGVINFWGVWCGPCVKEAPDIQRFYERFKDDPEIVFLTIDNDADVEMVRTWMAEKKFNFPVLVDSGFVRGANVNAFPTTWFIDREGRIAFTHVGASDVVFEEFVWRVELLKEDVVQPADAAPEGDDGRAGAAEGAGAPTEPPGAPAPGAPPW